MTDTFRRKLKIRTHSSMQWLEDLEQAYPLPDAPPDRCRDAFLRELLLPYQPSLESESTVESSSDTSTRIRFGENTEITSSFNAEAQLLNDLIRTVDKRRSASQTFKRSEDRDRLTGADLNRLLRERYGNIASALSFMAVLYQLQKLKDRLFIAREMWAINISTDKSLRLFSWSINDYLARFSLPNPSYCDAAERELGNQIECFKFRMDLREIDRLLEAIVDDLRNKRDLCDNSMLIIRDAETDIEEMLTKSQKEAAAEHHRIAMTAAQTPRSADPFGLKTRAVHTRINILDFMAPIEARYRIKWAQTLMEQSIHYSDLSLKEISDEIFRLHSQIDEIGHLWDVSSIAYDMQILGFKQSIMNWEMAYEESLENWRITIQTTRKRLSDAKDDLKYYREQIPMFHRKIAEVQAIMAQHELQERTASVRESRKSSRHSNKKKPRQKKK
ncbi:hypothetical protein ACLKA6_012695 [Drosophila palustris]